MEKETSVILEAYHKMYNKPINETHDPDEINVIGRLVASAKYDINKTLTKVTESIKEYLEHIGQDKLPIENIDKYLENIENIKLLVNDTTGPKSEYSLNTFAVALAMFENEWKKALNK